MFKSMILELAANGTCYFDNIKLQENKEYRKNYDEHYEILEKLCKDMTEEKKRETLNDLFDTQSAMLAMTADEYFKEGFKLGLIIGAQNFLE